MLQLDSPMTGAEILELMSPPRFAGDISVCVDRISSLDDSVSGSLFLARGFVRPDLVGELDSFICIATDRWMDLSSDRGLVIAVENPMAEFSLLLNSILSHQQLDPPEMSDLAIFELAEALGGKIGSQSTLVKGTTIGEKPLFGAGVRIGVSGLGFIDLPNERVRVPHIGSVRIGDNCVIGSGSVVVRGQFSDTSIGSNCRLGNLVNVGHNCALGSNVVISSNSVLGGGVQIGDNSELGIGVTVAPKVSIGKHVFVGAGSVVVKDLPDGSRVFGNPAKPLVFGKHLRD